CARIGVMRQRGQRVDRRRLAHRRRMPGTTSDPLTGRKVATPAQSKSKSPREFPCLQRAHIWVEEFYHFRESSLGQMKLESAPPNPVTKLPLERRGCSFS